MAPRVRLGVNNNSTLRYRIRITILADDPIGACPSLSGWRLPRRRWRSWPSAPTPSPPAPAPSPPAGSSHGHGRGVNTESLDGFARIRGEFARIRGEFAADIREFADGYTRVRESLRPSPRRVRESPRRVRASSREFAKVLKSALSPRRVRESPRCPHKFAASSRKSA